MNILLVHPKKARDYRVPVPPIGRHDSIAHATLSDFEQGFVASGVPGWAFDVIVLPDRSGLPPEQLDYLKTRLTRTGIMVVL